VCVLRRRRGYRIAATHNSLDEIARAADKDVGEVAQSIERSKELISGLHRVISSGASLIMSREMDRVGALTLKPSLHSPLLETR